MKSHTLASFALLAVSLPLVSIGCAADVEEPVEENDPISAASSELACAVPASTESRIGSVPATSSASSSSGISSWAPFDGASNATSRLSFVGTGTSGTRAVIEISDTGVIKVTNSVTAATQSFASAADLGAATGAVADLGRAFFQDQYNAASTMQARANSFAGMSGACAVEWAAVAAAIAAEIAACASCPVTGVTCFACWAAAGAALVALAAAEKCEAAQANPPCTAGGSCEGTTLCCNGNILQCNNGAYYQPISPVTGHPYTCAVACTATATVE